MALGPFSFGHASAHLPINLSCNAPSADYFSGAGDADHPFKTIAHALDAAQQASSPVTIVLRAGTFYQSDTLNIGVQHNGVTIQNYQGEEVRNIFVILSSENFMCVVKA